MELSIAEQAKQLIEKSQKILLVAHAKMDGDTLSAAIAMHKLLQKIGKKTVVACADAVPEVFSFLPETGVMEREISSGNDFVIALDCSRTQAQKLRWKIEGNELKIFVTPFGGKFQESDVKFSEQSDFDLIISIDAADRQQLGSIFEENTELFARVPLLVFDHHASNPGFGTVNVIDTKAASTTEVIFHFLPILFGEQWKKKIDADISTLLLTGIITDTASFQNPNTTPKSLEVAADLVEMGARQQEIIRHIFKTKNIPTLKLWGRVLSKIKTDPTHRMLWSTVSVDDLKDTGGTLDDMNGIVDELLATAPGMEMVLLLKERDDGVIAVSIRTTTPLCDAAAFSQEFGGGGHIQAAGFKIRANKPFDVIVGEVISSAQKFQQERFATDSGSAQTNADDSNVPSSSMLEEDEIELAAETPTDLAPEDSEIETEAPQSHRNIEPEDQAAEAESPPRQDDRPDNDVPTETATQEPSEQTETIVAETASDEQSQPAQDDQPAWLAPEQKQTEDTSHEEAASVQTTEQESSQENPPSKEETPPPKPAFSSHEDFSSMLEEMMRRDPLGKNKKSK